LHALTDLIYQRRLANPCRTAVQQQRAVSANDTVNDAIAALQLGDSPNQPRRTWWRTRHVRRDRSAYGPATL
jgi:hypothetical protein